MSADVPTPPRIFVSYSWDSHEHAERVRVLADQLRQHGIDCTLDQYDEAPPEGLTLWMTKHIRDDDFVLMICTSTYYRRVMGEEEPGRGLGACYEGQLIRTNFYHNKSLNTRFLPILLRPEDKEFIPDPFRDSTYYDLSTPEGYEKLYRRITGQPAIKPPALGAILELPAHEPGQWPAARNLGVSITPSDDPLQPLTRADFTQLKQELEGYIDTHLSNLPSYIKFVYPRVRSGQTTPVQPRDPTIRATFIVPAAKARLQNLLLELSPLGNGRWQLTNEHQADAAVTMSVVFHLYPSLGVEDDFAVDPNRGAVYIALPPGRSRTVRQVLDLYAVLRAMIKGNDFIVQNDEAGTIAFSGYGRLDTSFTPFEEELVDALQAIQDAYPLLDFFYPDELSRDEAEHIFRIGVIVRTGSDTRTLHEATMEIKVEVLAKLLAMLPSDGIARTLSTTQHQTTEILGTAIDLGDVDSSYCPLRFKDDDLERLRAKVQELASDSIVRIILVPAEDSNRTVVHRYMRFSRDGEGADG